MPISNLSDFNVSGTNSLIGAKLRLYSDLDLGFIPHPMKGDVIPLTDLDAIKNAVKNLVLTNKYERPFQPNIGGNVRALLFEPADNFTVVSLKESIKTTLARYEPRIDNVTIQIEDIPDRNEYNVTIGFRIREINQAVDVQFNLKRYR